MVEKYFLIKKKLDKSMPLPHPSIFLSVSIGNLELAVGDRSILPLLELKDGKPFMKPEAECDYEIYSFRNKQQFDWAINLYGDELREKARRERIHSMRESTSDFGEDRAITMGGND
jgi:hypothetical protein